MFERWVQKFPDYTYSPVKASGYLTHASLFSYYFCEITDIVGHNHFIIIAAAVVIEDRTIQPVRILPLLLVIIAATIVKLQLQLHRSKGNSRLDQ